MSIDLNWETLTTGPDGDALAERIRVFIHDKFQTVPLPRFIKSVAVHGFDFGKTPPQLELKDITDPLPDFYEEDLDDEESDDEYEEQDYHAHTDGQAGDRGSRHAGAGGSTHTGNRAGPVVRHEFTAHDLGTPFLGTSTPGILGGPGLSYFHSHMGGNGTHTPLAAVAGAHLGNNWMGSVLDASHHAPSHSRHASQSSISVDNFPMGLREKSSVSTLAPTSVGTSRPPTRDTHIGGDSAILDDDDDDDDAGGYKADQTISPEDPPMPRKEPRVEDVQAVFRIQYSGDIRLNLTAEILLDYPMPSFVGIPLKLNITGLTFDGVGVLAHIRKRVHFCFLSPEDALTAVGPDPEEDTEASKSSSSSASKHKPRFGGLLQEIKVDSEIGERESGKQSLKNVGKVEKFVLEQVRRIFEEEFVYPSFWTFLV